MWVKARWMDVVSFLVPLLAFLGIYAVLYVREKRRGEDPAIRWGWLAAIVLCAGAAVVLGNVI
jgi:hypothetical protein